MLRLAGVRINPQTNGPHLPPRNIGLIAASDRRRQAAAHRAAGGRQHRLSRLVARRQAAGLHHHDADSASSCGWPSVADAAARRVPGVTLNAAYGDPVQWMPDSRTLLVQTIPAGRGAPPAAPQTPPGPTIQESAGRAGPVRTYQDLLQNAHDEALFDYYCTSQLVAVDAPTTS